MKKRVLATVIAVVLLVGMIFIPSIGTASEIGNDGAVFSKADYPYDAQLTIYYTHWDHSSFSIVLKNPSGAIVGSWSPARNYPNMGTLTYSMSGQPAGVWTLEWTSTTSGYGSSTCTAGVFNIRGYVVDATSGICINGATVSCSGLTGSSTTGTNGQFTLTVMPGNRVLTATHSLHTTTLKSIYVTSNARFDINMARISGYPLSPNLPYGVYLVTENDILNNVGVGYVHANSAQGSLSTGICHAYVDAGTQGIGTHIARDRVKFMNYDFTATGDSAKVKFYWANVLTYYCHAVGPPGGSAIVSTSIHWELLDQSNGNVLIAGGTTYGPMSPPGDASPTPIIHPWSEILALDSQAIPLTQGHTIEFNCWLEVQASAIGLAGEICGAMVDLTGISHFATMSYMGIHWV